MATAPESAPGHMHAPGSRLVIQHSHIPYELSAANFSTEPDMAYAYFRMN